MRIIWFIFVQNDDIIPKGGLMKALASLVLLVGLAGSLMAGTTAPEIDSNSAVAAIALVSGGLLVLRGRRVKK